MRSLLALISVCLIGHSTLAQEPADQPREIGLKESAASRLVQIDVSVDASRETLETLTADDFDLVVNSRFIDDFLVDYSCPDLGTAGSAPGAEDDPSSSTGQTTGDSVPTEAATATARTRYLFYFDQVHLTLEGRQRALDMARTLVPRLLAEGSVASVISSAEELETYADRSGDPEEILSAIDDLERDRKQWSPWAQLEDKRVEEVYRSFDTDLDHAIATARRYQQEERWQSEKALRRLAMVLGRLADAPPPKAVIYFADTMRPNAGEHYSYLFAANSLNTTLAQMNSDGLTARNPYDRVIEAAGAYGIRLYTIQAQGLVARSGTLGTARMGLSGSGAGVTGGASAAPASQKLSDAQNGLAGFALETGGRAFLNGAPSRRVADYIRRDLSCPLLISFRADGLPEDRALPVTLRVLRAGVEAKTRGQIVIQSETKQRTARLMAAFAAPEQKQDERGLRGAVVPTHYEDGKYSALVQLNVPASPLSGAVWDMGASLISKGRVQYDTAGRIKLSRPGLPVVFETEMEFPPGEFEIAAVAHETTADQIASGQISGTLPDPRDQPASLAPVTVLQPQMGAFLRDGASRESGPVAVSLTQPLRTDVPTALVGMVCRNRPKKDRFLVERALEGEGRVSFPALQLDSTEERCTQFRDLIPAGTMTSGGFAYEVRVMDEDVELAATSVDFFALDPDDPLLGQPEEEQTASPAPAP
jgi:hypothetical protein